MVKVPAGTTTIAGQSTHSRKTSFGFSAHSSAADRTAGVREASGARATHLDGDSTGAGAGLEATGVGLGEGAADATGVAGAGADGPRMVKMPTPAATMQASATSPAINSTFRDEPT